MQCSTRSGIYKTALISKWLYYLITKKDIYEKTPDIASKTSAKTTVLTCLYIDPL